jgi:hypothetical protein
MADDGRKILGSTLDFEERLAIAQLTHQVGWKILVRLIAEACRRATEEVIKLDPSTDRYEQKLAGLQTKARAMNIFSAEVLDSVKLHEQKAMKEVKERENPSLAYEPTNRFCMPMPMPKSPAEGQQENK